jgi:6,7-dimethyl-8-ribityllumazine synthase
VKQASTERPSARGLRVAIVRTLFNASVTDGLLDGARQALAEMGAGPRTVTVVDAPGAFELPVLAQAAARSGRFDAIVALGAVIRGDTDHYEHIAREAATGLSRVALGTGVPVAFGVLTVERYEQAQARSVPGPDNKGAEAARAAVATAQALRALGSRSRRGTKR